MLQNKPDEKENPWIEGLEKSGSPSNMMLCKSGRDEYIKAVLRMRSDYARRLQDHREGVTSRDDEEVSGLAATDSQRIRDTMQDNRQEHIQQASACDNRDDTEEKSSIVSAALSCSHSCAPLLSFGGIYQVGLSGNGQHDDVGDENRSLGEPSSRGPEATRRSAFSTLMAARRPQLATPVATISHREAARRRAASCYASYRNADVNTDAVLTRDSSTTTRAETRSVGTSMSRHNRRDAATSTADDADGSAANRVRYDAPERSSRDAGVQHQCSGSSSISGGSISSLLEFGVSSSRTLLGTAGSLVRRAPSRASVGGDSSFRSCVSRSSGGERGHRATPKDSPPAAARPLRLVGYAAAAASSFIDDAPSAVPAAAVASVAAAGAAAATPADNLVAATVSATAARSAGGVVRERPVDTVPTSATPPRPPPSRGVSSAPSLRSTLIAAASPSRLAVAVAPLASQNSVSARPTPSVAGNDFAVRAEEHLPLAEAVVQWLNASSASPPVERLPKESDGGNGGKAAGRAGEVDVPGSAAAGCVLRSTPSRTLKRIYDMIQENHPNLTVRADADRTAARARPPTPNPFLKRARRTKRLSAEKVVEDTMEPVRAAAAAAAEKAARKESRLGFISGLFSSAFGGGSSSGSQR